MTVTSSGSFSRRSSSSLARQVRLTRVVACVRSWCARSRARSRSRGWFVRAGAMEVALVAPRRAPDAAAAAVLTVRTRVRCLDRGGLDTRFYDFQTTHRRDRSLPFVVPFVVCTFHPFFGGPPLRSTRSLLRPPVPCPCPLPTGARRGKRRPERCIQRLALARCCCAASYCAAPCVRHPLWRSRHASARALEPALAPRGLAARCASCKIWTPSY